MRISVWISDVCSSDLAEILHRSSAGPSDSSLGEAKRAGTGQACSREKVRRGPACVPGRYRNAPRYYRACSDAVARYRASAGSAQRSRSEEHTSELQSLMRNSYAVFCLKKKKNQTIHN